MNTLDPNQKKKYTDLLFSKKKNKLRILKLVFSLMRWSIN